jgi:hypothetical protein
MELTIGAIATVVSAARIDESITRSLPWLG